MIMYNEYMNKEDLKQYRFITSEYEAIQICNHCYEDLMELMNQYKTDNQDQINERLNAIIRKNQKQIDELKKKQKDIDSWLDSLNDPVIKQAIELRFIHGYSWREVAETVTHGYVERKAFSQQVLRFIDKYGG